MVVRLCAALAVLSLVLTTSSALYSDDSDVVPVTADNFHEVVTNSKAVVMVQFYLPDDKASEALTKEYEKVARSLADIVTVAAVDCAEEEKLCASMAVKAYPTLRVYADEKSKNPYTGQIGRTPLEYQGPPTAGSIAKALKGLIPSPLDTITDEGSWTAFKDKASDGLPMVVLATTSRTTTPLYKSLATRFKGQMHFAEVHKEVTESHNLEGLSVESFPQLSVLKADGDHVVYSGDLKAGLLRAFLSEHAAEETEGDAGNGSGEGAEPALEPLLQPLEAGDFEAKVLQDDLAVLVAFMGDGGEQCAEAKEQLEASLADGQGMLPMYLLSVVKGEKSEELASAYSDDSTSISDAISSAPCVPKLAIFPFGLEAKEDEDPEVFAGDLAERADVQGFIFDNIPTMSIRVTDDIFQQFSWTEPEKPKVFLLTAKEETGGAFKALAMNFYKDFMFAEIHKSQKDALATFPNAKFPSIYIMMLAPTTTEEGQPQLQIFPLQAPLKFPYMKAFLQSVKGSMAGQQQPGGGPEPGAAAGSGQLLEVSSEETFQSVCVGAGGLCVVAFLDPAQESDLEKRTTTLKKVMGKYDGSAFRFMWMDGKGQSEFAAALDVRSSDIPTLTVISPSKLRYATLRGAFVESSIVSHLDGILTGKVKTVMLQELPKVVEGGAAVEEEYIMEEEEFDLSDIMDEEVEEAAVTNEQRLKEAEEELKREAEEAARRAKEASAAKAKKSSKKSKSKKSKSKSAKKEEL